LDFVG